MNNSNSRRVLIVYAHPEPQSLNGSIKNAMVGGLQALGHQVLVSDLYAMRFKAVADADDFAEPLNAQRLNYATESKHAYDQSAQQADVIEEQRRLLWADAVIFQFPLWWYSSPAILKGWIDRVLVCGFAYGLFHEGTRRVARYGEGRLLGKRAVVSLTTGAPASNFGPRGVCGALEDLLFPLQHGTLFYMGMQVLPHFAVHRAGYLGADDWPSVEKALQLRLQGLFSDAPIPFRQQNGGHYDERFELRANLGGAETGLLMHQVRAGEPEQTPPQPLTFTGM